MIEYLIITVLVIWSAGIVFKKLLPKTSNTAFAALSVSCEQRGWYTLAKWLKPKISAGCAGGCGCAADDKAMTKHEDIKPIKWH